MKTIEGILKLKLPEDFCQVANFYSGGLLGGISCCSKARIGDSGRYINIKDRKALDAVLEKYGMTFPCL